MKNHIKFITNNWKDACKFIERTYYEQHQRESKETNRKMNIK